MAAYVIVDYYDMLDRDLYEEYSRVGAPLVRQYGGVGLAGSDRVEVLDGDWRPRRLVLLEFPDAARAREWFASPAVAEAARLRRRAAKCNLILVEGN